MSAPEWLPPLVLLEDFNGDWAAYVQAIYEFFKQDFIDSKPVFRGRRLGLKRHPLSHGKEATYWHMTSEGMNEAERTPDLRRCERIRWPRPVIDQSEDPAAKVWVAMRGKEKRIHIWLESQDYLVVLADRDSYLLPWTAYCIEYPHKRAKLQKEYEAYVKAVGQKG